MLRKGKKTFHPNYESQPTSSRSSSSREPKTTYLGANLLIGMKKELLVKDEIRHFNLVGGREILNYVVGSTPIIVEIKSSRNVVQPARQPHLFPHHDETVLLLNYVKLNVWKSNRGMKH